MSDNRAVILPLGDMDEALHDDLLAALIAAGHISEVESETEGKALVRKRDAVLRVLAAHALTADPAQVRIDAALALYDEEPQPPPAALLWEVYRILTHRVGYGGHETEPGQRPPPGWDELQQERDSWAGRAQLLYADLKHAEARLSRLLADLRGRNETWKRQGYTGLGINIDALLVQYDDVPAPDLGAGSTQP